jgi:hypothetical protein
MALKQQYKRLLMDYDQLRQMVMDIRSRMGDDTCATLFWSYGPGTTSLLLLHQLRRYSSLILF